ncbi:predicted protein [Naegleria gruberi]|uniref:Predicted protein n=1 Tax=Naegleria gruberi TaxID=5762 RepID=D2VVV0_NAEGR|nr:uncharacterized protein NAEGRDRAFT_73149 [Naegleria gruberi]EFC39167.1 predicted protein [Naegleria gruberi]|eukprot:XP_002671911.1 predicted protein [Naegleria gruberi strain NEG-M]
MPKQLTSKKPRKLNKSVKKETDQATQPDNVSIASSSTSSCPSSPPSLPRIKKLNSCEKKVKVDLSLIINQENHLPLLLTQDFNRLEIQSSSGLTLEVLQHFLNSEKCRNITSLRFGRMDFDDAAIVALVESPFLTNVKELELFCSNISPDSFGMLANCSKLLTLETLIIHNNPDFGPKSVKSLVQSPYLVNLKRLELVNTFIGDEGLKILCESNKFEHVKRLNLQGNLLTDSSYQLLRNTQWIRDLDNLVVCGNYLVKSLNKKKALELKDTMLASQLN